MAEFGWDTTYFKHYMKEGNFLVGKNCKGCRMPSEDLLAIVDHHPKEDKEKKEKAKKYKGPDKTVIHYCDKGCKAHSDGMREEDRADWCECWFCTPCFLEANAKGDEHQSGPGKRSTRTRSTGK